MSTKSATRHILRKQIKKHVSSIIGKTSQKLEQIIKQETGLLHEGRTHILPSCITPGLIVAKKVARRFDFEESYQISISNALRIAIYNEVIDDGDLEKLIKILEQIITTEGSINKQERRALQDAMESLGSMYSKSRPEGDLDEPQPEEKEYGYGEER